MTPHSSQVTVNQFLVIMGFAKTMPRSCACLIVTAIIVLVKNTQHVYEVNFGVGYVLKAKIV
jgi:hypothetical protein